MRSTGGVLAVATAMTLVAWFENSIAPWAPFFIAHAVLAFAIPLRLGTFEFGSLASWHPRTWVLLFLSALGLQIAGTVWAGILFPGLLGTLGVEGAQVLTSYYSAQAALDEVFQGGAERWNTVPGTIGVAYVVFVALWAGLGEELFYRGYVHGVLEKERGFRFAAFVSSLFFAVRHATQLALVEGSYPWGASVSWMVFALFFGLVMSWLYTRFGSLYPPVFVHYLFNAIALVAFALGGGES